jgi:hypothetical protein
MRVTNVGSAVGSAVGSNTDACDINGLAHVHGGQCIRHAAMPWPGTPLGFAVLGPTPLCCAAQNIAPLQWLSAGAAANIGISRRYPGRHFRRAFGIAQSSPAAGGLDTQEAALARVAL